MAAAGAAGQRSLTAPVAAGLALVALLGLVACGSSDDNPYDLSEYSAGASQGTAQDPGIAASGAASPGEGAGTGKSPAASGSAGGTAAPAIPGPTFDLPPAPRGALTYEPADVFGRGAWVRRGAIEAADASQRAVADAALAYLSARVQLSNTWRVDESRLAELATGQALSSARARAQDQRAAQSHSIGPFVVNLATVAIKGDRARVSGCPFDGTMEISTEGGLLRNYPGGVALSMDLARTGKSWRVSTFPATEKFCEAPSR